MAEILATLNQALAGRYLLDKQIGAGGMATVFLARDLRHNRPVAFKVLHSELASVLGPERFQREIKLAARLQHPHILTVHDSGEDAGRLWFTMPFVEGESLRDRLLREKQLPLDDAVRIARQIGEALHYAHEHGIIHRDIKPENILLTGSHALVADFGIARALRGEADSLTQTGLVVGTPTYMSPEQASGGSDVDARTDVYALGCVLYEMLAGEPPFTGPTPQAVISKRMATPAPSVAVVRDGIPPGVEQALAKALSRSPVDRHRTTAEFTRALDSQSVVGQIVTPPAALAPAPPTRRWMLPAAAGLALVLAISGFLAWRSRTTSSESTTTASGPKTLAVLPFENLGPANQEYFASGITDEVRGKLTSIADLRVTARSSSNQYKKSDKTPKQIGDELGVQYLLTGTVAWEPNPGGKSRVKVSPELIEVSTAAARWQQPFDAVLDDVFQVQANIASQVAGALGVALGGTTQQQLAERPTANLGAYEAFLRGSAVNEGSGGFNPATLRGALTHYEQAVALDPGFLQAWTELSRLHSRIYYIGVPTPRDADLARQTAERALQIGPNRAEAHVALGDYYQFVLSDSEKALQEYTESQRLSPADADVLIGLALAEQTLGRWESSVEKAERAAQLDPRSITTARRLGATLLRLRRHKDAIRAFDRGLAISPANLNLLEEKAMVYLAEGDVTGARAVLAGASREIDTVSLVTYIGNYWDLAWLLTDEQQAALLRLTPSAFDNDRGAWGFVLAQTAALRGETAQVHKFAEFAERAYSEQIQSASDNSQLFCLRSVVLAYLGRSAEAIRDGERGLALQPPSKDAYGGPYNQHQLVRTYILVGQPEKALDLLEPLLKMPYYLTPAWLRIDPNFIPLRDNPRFKRLAGL